MGTNLYLRRPFWLSPRQIVVIPVAAPYVSSLFIFNNKLCFGAMLIFFFLCEQRDYAAEITDRLSALGLFADVDNGENTLPKKIRNGEIAQYNFILGMHPFFNNIALLITNNVPP